MSDWPLRKLGDVAKIVSGATPKTKIPEYWDGDILWATPKDLGQLREIEIEDTERKISRPVTKAARPDYYRLVLFFSQAEHRLAIWQ
jgi:type I restriction enzyme S subunit